MIGHVSFTGTRLGMSPYQRAALRTWLHNLLSRGYHTFHHGDCIGADEQAHVIAAELGFNIVIHPPINEKNRAFCHKKKNVRTLRDNQIITVLPQGEYFDRNHDIVNSCEGMVATPKTQIEEIRSGTWEAIRYARKNCKPVKIL